MSEMEPDLSGERGYMGAADIAFLRYAASRAVEGSLLNVGCYKGLSCSVLATVGPELTCVDTFEGGEGLQGGFYNVWDSNMRQCGIRDRIHPIRGRSQEVLRDLPSGAYRLIFIDGSHQYVNALKDFIHSLRLLAPGGWIIFDDAAFGEVRQAANEAFGETRWEDIPDTKMGMLVKR